MFPLWWWWWCEGGAGPSKKGNIQKYEKLRWNVMVVMDEKQVSKGEKEKER